MERLLRPRLFYSPTQVRLEQPGTVVSPTAACPTRRRRPGAQRLPQRKLASRELEEALTRRPVGMAHDPHTIWPPPWEGRCPKTGSAGRPWGPMPRERRARPLPFAPPSSVPFPWDLGRGQQRSRPSHRRRCRVLNKERLRLRCCSIPRFVSGGRPTFRRPAVWSCLRPPCFRHRWSAHIAFQQNPRPGSGACAKSAPRRGWVMAAGCLRGT